MMTATGIRKEAREHLAGKWGKGILITLAYLAIELVIGWIVKGVEDSTALNFIFSIGEFVVSIPLTYGLTIAFMKLKRDEEVAAFDFLTLGFSRFSKGWKVFGNIVLKLIAPIIAIIIVYVVMTVALSASLFMGMSMSVHNTNDVSQIGAMVGSFGAIGIIAILAILACSVWLYIKQLSVILSYNIAYDEPELTGKQVVEKSQFLMQENKGNYFVLTLSFIGWALLATLTFGIGFLWLAPYMQVAFVCFYDTLVNKTEKPEIIEENVNV